MREDNKFPMMLLLQLLNFLGSFLVEEWGINNLVNKSKLQFPVSWIPQISGYHTMNCFLQNSHETSARKTNAYAGSHKNQSLHVESSDQIYKPGNSPKKKAEEEPTKEPKDVNKLVLYAMRVYTEETTTKEREEKKKN